MKTYSAIVVGIIIGLLAGVGAFQIGIAGTVSSHGVEIRNLQMEVSSVRETFEARMANVIRLWEAQLASERELISLVREQNRIIERQDRKVNQ